MLDADIQGFFDNLSHKIIMDAVRAEVADGNILNLVERFLTAGVVEEGDFTHADRHAARGAMKLKRKNYNDNRKLRVRYFRRKLGLLSLEQFCLKRQVIRREKYGPSSPTGGQLHLGSPGE